MARLMPPVSPCGPWPCSGTSTPTELALAAMTRLVARRSTTLTASSTIPTGSTTCSSPPPWEVINYEPRTPIESGNPHADEEAPRCGAAPGAPTGQPGAPPAAAPDRACQQQRQALSDCERPDPPVEGGRPRSGDGALLCPAQFPGAPEPLATHDLIGINSIIGVDCDGLSVLLPL